MKKRTRQLYLIVSLVFLLMLILSLFSSSLPDGFEKTVETIASVDSPEQTAAVSKTSPLRSITEAALGATAAFLMIFFLLRILKLNLGTNQADNR